MSSHETWTRLVHHPQRGRIAYWERQGFRVTAQERAVPDGGEPGPRVAVQVWKPQPLTLDETRHLLQTLDDALDWARRTVPEPLDVLPDDDPEDT